ncbi:MAG TPA: c-type cytochrome [Terriglobales bacterium]|nr:c-type cytochrome [Terriglobales bacterium]
MEFPIFQVPYLGNGMTIALNAVLHLIIAQGITTGVITMIALAEYIGFKKSSEHWENFARQLLKPTIVIVTGAGSITGVGIWFITSALSPKGIGLMLRIFFWPWFVEWLAFAVEVIVILLYFFTWEKWTGEKKKKHIRMGFAYSGLAIFSAFLITGILGFMLTSDGWPWNRSFWSAFFNPSFPPQLFLRLGIAFSLGSVFASAYLVLVRHETGFRKEALRFFGKIALVFLALALVSTWWYFSVVPSRFKTHAVFSVLTSHFSQHPEFFWILNILGVIALLLFSLVALRGSIFSSKVLVIPAILFFCGFVTEYERVREFIRGPFLLPGYLYSNQVQLDESLFWKNDGTLKNSYWYSQAGSSEDTVAQGTYLFGQNCSTCHTMGGLNDIKDRVQGRSEDGIYVILGNTHQMVPFMPPFSGNDGERRALSAFLYQLANGQIKIEEPSRFLILSREDKNE